MPVELTESLLAKAAGWDVMKHARHSLEQGRVLSSFWAAPLLRGVVQEGESSHRASMVIHSGIDIENLCTCREAREWGKICSHVVAVGLHWLNGQKNPAASALGRPPQGATAAALAARKSPALRRDAAGEPATLFIILPPNFEQALARGKVMLALEAQWGGGRAPLNALPKDRSFAFPIADSAIIDQLEILTNGETPAILQLETKDFVSLLPALADHPNITLGRSSAVIVTTKPFQPPLRATLEANGEITLARSGEAGPPPVMIGDWLWRERVSQPLGLPPAIRDMLRAPVRLPRTQVPQFLSRH